MKVTAYIRHTQVDKAGSRPRLSPDLAPENIIGCVSKDRWKQASMISENQTKSRAPCTTAMTYKVVLKEEELGFPLGIYSQEEREGEQSDESTLQRNKPQQDKGNIHESQESALVFLRE